MFMNDKNILDTVTRLEYILVNDKEFSAKKQACAEALDKLESVLVQYAKDLLFDYEEKISSQELQMLITISRALG